MTAAEFAGTRSTSPEGVTNRTVRTGLARLRTSGPMPSASATCSAAGDRPDPQILLRGKRSRSTSSTSLMPSWPSCTAAAAPAGPAPTMRISVSMEHTRGSEMWSRSQPSTGARKVSDSGSSNMLRSNPVPQTAERPVASPRRPRFVGELDTLIRARYPLVYLVSSEEGRVEELLRDIARGHGKSLIGWSAVRGLHRLDETRGVPLPGETEEPYAALQALRGLQEPALVVLKDLHAWLDDRRLVRALRELGQSLKSSYTTLILLAPVLQIPVELEKEIAVLDVPLPTFAELAELLRDIVGVVRKTGRITVDLRREEGEQLVKAALGLTLQEAENAFAKAIADDDRLDASDIQRVMDEKRQVIRKSGLLEYYPVDHALAAVGGLQNLKDWLHRRARAFTAEAHAFGLPEPRGLLLLGVQGCGKSL